MEEWNFGVEQQLSPSTILRLAYAGRLHTMNCSASIPIRFQPRFVPTRAAVCPAASATAKGSVAQGAQYIPVGTRPNPFLSGGFFWYTEGNSSYNALEAEVIRRLSRGLQFRANYTWSKNLDMNSGLTGAQANNQAQMVLDRNDLRRDWGLAALNITSQSSISAHYELPFGPGRRWLANARGWEEKLAERLAVEWHRELAGGFPFTPQIGSNWSGRWRYQKP